MSNVKILIVCGGAGKALLGHLDALEFHAEVQIDVQDELVADLETGSRSFQISLNPPVQTVRKLVAHLKAKYENENSSRKRQAAILDMQFPMNANLSTGLSQAPAIGGATVRYPDNVDQVRTTLTRILNNIGQRLGPKGALEVWIVSSTAGGTGAGIRRFVANTVAEVMNARSTDTTVELHFIGVGARTYVSIGGQTTLNTFLSVAADAAFGLSISRQYKHVVPRFYYLELPDVGSGDEARYRREELAKVTIKVIMLAGVQQSLRAMAENNPNGIVFVRVGYWGAEFDNDQLYYEALKQLENKLDEFINPDAEQIRAGRSARFEKSQELTGYIEKKEKLLQRMPPGWKFPNTRVNILRSRDPSQYIQMCDNAVRQFFKPPSLANLGTYSIVRNDNKGDEPLILVPWNPEAPWSEKYLAIRKAQEVQIWCKELLPNLEKQRMSAARDCSQAQYKPGADSDDRTKALVERLPAYLELTAQVNKLQELNNQARNQLDQLMKPVRNIYEEVRERKPSAATLRSAKPVILIAELDDLLDASRRQIWLEILDRAISSRNESAIRKAILCGVGGLTRSGLGQVFRLPYEQNEETIVERVKQIAMQKAGGILIDGQEQEGLWWQAADLTNRLADMYRYRIFPKLERDVERELQAGTNEKNINFKVAPIGSIGLRVLAVDIGTIGDKNDAISAPATLLHPLVDRVHDEIRLWEHSGQRNLAAAGVGGEPLYREALTAVDLKPDELGRLEWLYDLYSPPRPASSNGVQPARQRSVGNTANEPEN